jgi:hypothetical protein
MSNSGFRHMSICRGEAALCKGAHAPPKIFKNSEFDKNSTIYAPLMRHVYAPTKCTSSNFL